MNESPYPKVVGDFRLLKKIGQGGMGIVFEAEQISLARRVAVKLLPPSFALDEQSVARFHGEAKSLASLTHPNIMPVYQVGESDGFHYFSMHLVDGLTLAELLEGVQALSSDRFQGAQITRVIRDHSPLVSAARPFDATVSVDQPPDADATRSILGPRVTSEEELREKESRAVPASLETVSLDREYISTVCTMIAAAADGLAYVHENGIIHRDIKPSNLMIEGASGRVLIMDFGLAREVGSSHLTQTGQLTGTPAYMSPEQIQAQKTSVDYRTDIYSLGITLYEFLTHRRPFFGVTGQEIARNVLTGNPVRPRRLNPRLSKDLETIVIRAIEVSPDHRYQKASELADDLRRYMNLEPILARPIGPVVRSVRYLRRHRALSAAIVSALLVLFLFGGFSLAGSLRRGAQVQDAVSRGNLAVKNGDIPGASSAAAEGFRLAPKDPSVNRLRSEVELMHVRNALIERKRLAASIEELEVALQEGNQFETDFMAKENSADYRSQEEELDRQIRERSVLEQRVMSQFSLAFSADPGNTGVRAAELEFYVGLWEEACDREDLAAESFYAERVAALDVKGRFREGLRGKGALLVQTEEPGVAVHLFRYRRIGGTNGEQIRLAPAPCLEDGTVQDDEFPPGFLPGQTALCVMGVAQEGEAAKLGLEADDLILSVEDLPLEAVVAGEVAFNRLFVAAGVLPLDRLVSLDGKPIGALYDFERWVGKVANARRDLKLVFDTQGGEREVTIRFEDFGELLRIRPQRLDDVLSNHVFSRDVRLQVLSSREGGVREVVLGKGVPLQAEVLLTAYPLAVMPQSVVGVTPCEFSDLARGSYLMVLRQDGKETLRYPVIVKRGSVVETKHTLSPAGSSPDGFVWIPPGPSVVGGDRLAYRPRSRHEVTLGGFFLSRFEVSVAEYFGFCNAPEIRRRYGRSTRDLMLPGATKEGVPIEPPYFWQDGYPVPYISLDKAHEYVDWFNDSRREDGFEYFLPSRDEWEKAARGTDERIFPWGNLFTWHCCKGYYSRPEFLPKIGLEPRGSFLCDESPYGIRDLAGSVREWTSTVVRLPLVDAGGKTYTVDYHLVQGGSYSLDTMRRFRVASTQRKKTTSGHLGFRIAARRQNH